MSEWGDYAAEAEARREPVGDNAKAVLDSQVTELWEIEKEIADLEEQLKKAKERHRKMAEHTIPATFEDMGLDDDSVIKVGGVQITIKQSVHASPKAANREDVYDWLERHGHGGLIKRTGVFRTGRDNEKKFRRWIKSIKTYDGTFERKVEPATLRSFVKEQLAQGNEIPMDLFGAYTRRVATVKAE